MTNEHENHPVPIRELRLRNRTVVYTLPAKTMKQKDQEMIDKLKQHSILPSDVQKITVKELQNIAKQRGIRGYSNKNKKDLTDFIVLKSVGPPPTALQSLQKQTVKELKKLAMHNGMRGYANKNKKDLVDFLYPIAVNRIRSLLTQAGTLCAI